MDSGFNQDQSELRVLVLSVSLQMFTDLNSLLDKHVKILGYLGCKSVGFQDTYDLLTSDGFHLRNTVRVTQDDTNLGWGQALLGELADVFLNIGCRDLAPRWRSALVRQGTLGDTLSGSMHTTHAENKEI